ncbi:MAG: DUF4738 domain-containing protein [Bacteroides sp.]|nr:DUF4738 domain-containing protein [Bacteroides sp.]
MISEVSVMKRNLILMTMSAVVFTACGNGTGKVEDDSRTETTVQEEESVVHRLPRLHVEDTCRVGGNTYSWVIDRVACDSLGIIEDDMGFRYADNTVKIVVRRNGGVLYSRTFAKADFAHLLGSDFFSKSILDGCRFLQVQDGKVTFSLAVSYPDSDMSQPFKLDIASDGSTRLVKYNDMEDEYLPDSLLDAGV